MSISFRVFDPERDGEQLRDWLSTDPVHSARYGDKFADGENVEVFVASRDGRDFAYVRVSKIARLEMVWPPDKGLWLARALRSGIRVFAALCRRAGMREIVFESDSKDLVSFMKGTAGFTESGYYTAPVVKE